VRTEIETERLSLRLPRPADADAWSAATEDAEVMRFIGGSAGAASQSIERFLERWDANGFGQYTTLPDAGDAAEVELGWALLRDHWGHGYATEAAEAVRYAAWADLELERVVSLIHPDNARSIGVDERLGARFERDVESADVGQLQVWVYER
jgi:RimJ/RimL family protein N-acetyltransferase